MNPSAFIPTKLTDFIGPARTVFKVLQSKVDRLKKGGGNLKALFYGPPGCGKTAVANAVARDLSGNHLAVEAVNGKEVGVDKVHSWIADLGTSSLWGDWQVKIVDELDLCSTDAQNLLLTYLDRLPPSWAFIGTSNLQLNLLQERFQTRLQQFKMAGPDSGEITDLLVAGFGLDIEDAEQIALGCGGNVRAALLDAETFLDAAAATSGRGKKGGRK